MMNVLVVDDSEIFRSGIVAHLESGGGMTSIRDIAYSEDKIIQELDSSTDLIIIDFEHHRNFGLDLIKRLKQFNQKLNLIIFTHERNLSMKLLSEHYGADYFLTKENQHQNLWQIIDNIKYNFRGKYD
ncbi:MAG: hypothetical protein SCALA702_10870 [Melioribacteraceae bacterium]|nr:MAG: hypothetical protein SCALA702_10870 [Melioribacteraceae bacterium]